MALMPKDYEFGGLIGGSSADSFSSGFGSAGFESVGFGRVGTTYDLTVRTTTDATNMLHLADFPPPKEKKAETNVDWLRSRVDEVRHWFR